MPVYETPGRQGPGDLMPTPLQLEHALRGGCLFILADGKSSRDWRELRLACYCDRSRAVESLDEAIVWWEQSLRDRQCPEWSA